MRNISIWGRILACLCLAAGSRAVTAAPLSWNELDAIPLPAPGERLNYGSAPQQFGELRMPPSGKGPFPILVILHGGCWQAEYDYVYITRLSAWFADRGIATWTPEYRRIGDAGGGWPGTFLDVGAAVDGLRHLATTHPLDLSRVVVAGHSAGGQLALWLASRTRLPDDSPLHTATPMRISGVLGLAAITDLYTYRNGPAGSCHSAVDDLMGGTPASQANRYAEASPLQRLPLGVPQVFLQGDLDPIVNPKSVQDYVAAATSAGDQVRLLTLRDAGHFDTAVPVPVSIPSLQDALGILFPRLPAAHK